MTAVLFRAQEDSGYKIVLFRWRRHYDTFSDKLIYFSLNYSSFCSIEYAWSMRTLSRRNVAFKLYVDSSNILRYHRVEVRPSHCPKELRSLPAWKVVCLASMFCATSLRDDMPSFSHTLGISGVVASRPLLSFSWTWDTGCVLKDSNFWSHGTGRDETCFLPG